MTDSAAEFGKVAVLMGGRSAERAVSLDGGKAVLASLQRSGVNAVGIDAGADVLAQLQAGGFDRVFILLHGRGGEDGVIQGALETLGLPYTGSGVAGSALGMDKYRCKLLWCGLGLPTPPFAMLRGEQDLAAAAALGFPLMIKPVHEGSSIGMTRVEDAAGLHAAWRAAADYDREVMAERWVTGAEFTVAILGDEALPAIRLETPHLFYDYDAKYHADTTSYHCPAGLAEDQEMRLRELARAAFKAVGASGWGRVDILVNQDDEPFLIEVNTVPGMTSHSLVPMAARANGVDFDRLVWRILELGMGQR
ncbi:MAG: D-alanine--D-alanine ligase [Chromatiaceae bacterium]|nr:D-alanine--D-alanine ligase [Chromatiaceae bacterium]MCP5447830.1 D-alanine--D-alanine ligase [Chromatiaceae bacterium]